MSTRPSPDAPSAAPPFGVAYPKHTTTTVAAAQKPVSHADRLAALQSYIPKKNATKPTPTEYTTWGQYAEADRALVDIFSYYDPSLTLGAFIMKLRALRPFFTGLQGDRAALLPGKLDAQIKILDDHLSTFMDKDDQSGVDPPVDQGYFLNLGKQMRTELAACKADAEAILGGSQWEGRAW